MTFSFVETLNALGRNAAFDIMNRARPTSDYLFQTLLPEMPMFDYTVKSGTMTVRSTMAGLTAMDSPYPPGGVIETSTFLENTAKIANEVGMPEEALRTLQQFLRDLLVNNSPTNEWMQREALNFLEKVIIQPHLDTAEWLRGQALVTGAINWTYNKSQLVVDYGIPAANLFAQRTGTAAYGGSASVFWNDVRLARKVLRHNVRTWIAHPDTIDEILYNDANKLQINQIGEMQFTIQRLIGDNERPATDPRDVVTLMSYDKEAEILDPANPDDTIKIPFMPVGKILIVANNTRSGYRVGEGATDDPVKDLALGYTHLAPTTESGGNPGRWAELYVPERYPMRLHGRGVQNVLPVIENPEKIVVLSTAMS